MPADHSRGADLFEGDGMNEKNTGGPAFPHQKSEHDVIAGGVTVRDYFAAKAMQGIVGSIDSEENYKRLNRHALAHGLKTVSAWIARDAYKQADAMLAERERAKP